MKELKIKVMVKICQCSAILGRLDYPSEKICTKRQIVAETNKILHFRDLMVWI